MPRPDGVVPDHLPNPEGLPRVLSRAEAFEAGLSRRAIDHRLATRRWHLILPRTYLTGSTLTWTDRVAAALSFAGTESVLSGAAALADLRLTGVRRPDHLLLLVPPTCRVRSTGFVRIRPTTRDPGRALVPGPRRAELARCVADLALERRRLDDVRALVIQAVRAGLCTPDELAAQLLDGPRRGSAHLRRALTDVGAGAWSAPEAATADLLRSARVPAFEQNARIELSGGRYLVADFLWRRLRAILEVDSDRYHGEPGSRDATDRRHVVLETEGYSVTHWRPSAIARDPAGFTSATERWLARRAGRPMS